MVGQMEQTQPDPTPKGVYVYCIIRLKQPRSFGPLGIGGREDQVYTVHHKDLAAVVSDTPLIVYDPTRDNVFAHEHVNETVLSEFTVLPLAFGTLFRSKEDVIEILRRTYDTLLETLTKIEGKVEFSLKVSWDRDRVLTAIEQENSEIRQLKEKITSGASSSTYYAQIDLGRLIENALNQRAEIYLRDIHSMLGGTVVASQSNKTIGENMIMNAAFLIERAREAEFVEAIERTAAKYEESLSFKFSGPWPPYNFVQIRLKVGEGEGQ